MSRERRAVTRFATASRCARAPPRAALRLGLDRDQRMTEKPRRLPVTRRPEAFSTAIPALEVDLRGVLCRDNASSGTTRSRPPPDGLKDLLGRHIGRTQKARAEVLRPDRRPLCATPTNRSSPPAQKNCTCMLSTQIAKTTNLKLFFRNHRCLQIAPGAVDHSGKPPRICISPRRTLDSGAPATQTSELNPRMP